MLAFLLYVGLIGGLLTLSMVFLWFIARFALPEWCAIPLLVGCWLAWALLMRLVILAWMS